MKKSLLFFLVLFGVTNVFAQRAFIRLNGTSHAYYQIDSVFLTAQNNDTIYLPGGGYSIGTLTIDKKLVIYGAGHYPDSTTATYQTYLGGSIVLTDNASNGCMSGIYLTGGITFGTNAGNSDLIQYTISRCNVQSIVMNFDYWTPGTASYIYVRENVVRDIIRGCNAQYVSVENNTIGGSLNFFNGNLLVRNNNFLGGTGCPSYCIADILNSTLENNIFMNNGACWVAMFGGTVASCIFNNNVFDCPVTFPWGTNIGNGNYTSVPLTAFFVSENDFVFDYTSNYHLQAPATYLGTDGLQVGWYGGPVPYKEAAVPANPHIRSKNIPASTDASGNLNVIISVGAQQQ